MSSDSHRVRYRCHATNALPRSTETLSMLFDRPLEDHLEDEPGAPILAADVLRRVNRIDRAELLAQDIDRLCANALVRHLGDQTGIDRAQDRHDLLCGKPPLFHEFLAIGSLSKTTDGEKNLHQSDRLVIFLY